MPNGLITDDSLRAHPDGFAVSLTIPWYRSLWLSSVVKLELTVDGEEIPQEDLTFELNGTRYPLDQAILVRMPVPTIVVHIDDRHTRSAQRL